jgi:hypothetical protein
VVEAARQLVKAADAEDLMFEVWDDDLSSGDLMGVIRDRIDDLDIAIAEMHKAENDWHDSEEGVRIAEGVVVGGHQASEYSPISETVLASRLEHPLGQLQPEVRDASIEPSRMSRAQHHCHEFRKRAARARRQQAQQRAHFVAFHPFLESIVPGLAGLGVRRHLVGFQHRVPFSLVAVMRLDRPSWVFGCHASGPLGSGIQCVRS